MAPPDPSALVRPAGQSCRKAVHHGGDLCGAPVLFALAFRDPVAAKGAEGPKVEEEKVEMTPGPTPPTEEIEEELG